MMKIPLVTESMPFPATDHADASGLLAVSTELSSAHVFKAYSQGIFPWYSPGQPVLWWSPDPRMLLNIADFKLHRSLKKRYLSILKDPAWQIRVDVDFERVMRACANQYREGQDGTWITDEIVAAYLGLHRAGFAHSIETWYGDQLLAGLYGVSLGRMFFGESMFTTVTDGSKLALMCLVAYLQSMGYDWIDCQQETQHLASVGALPVARQVFTRGVRERVALPAPDWTLNNLTQMPTTCWFS